MLLLKIIVILLYFIKMDFKHKKIFFPNDIYIILLQTTLLQIIQLQITHIFAQSLIVGIPSADVVHKNHIEFTHETQTNFWEKKDIKWNSFNFLTLGLGSNSEITLSANNLNNENSRDLALGLGVKKYFPIFQKKHEKWEFRWTIGGNILTFANRLHIGHWAYSHLSMRLPTTKTRLTGGLSQGTAHVFGFKQVLRNDVLVSEPYTPLSMIAGIEQPITKNVSFVADWYSGTHSLGMLIPCIQVNWRNSIFIAGYKIPNDPNDYNAVILEWMLDIPLKKKKEIKEH